MAAHRLGNIVFVSRSALLFFLALLAFIITSIVSIAGRGSATQYEDTYIRPSTSFAKESESHEVINDRTDSPSESQTGSEPSYCETSRKASHGFICEPDQTWAIRKEIFERQEKLQENQRKDPWFTERGKMGRWWQNNYEPTFSCTLEKRIGTQGDGGKWVCDPHRIPEITGEEHKKCVVFSIGSRNDYSFERSILEDLPACDVHTFDHTVVPMNVPEGVNFHQTGLGTEDSGNISTLATMMKDNNIGEHDSVEILKIDVEGAEWDVFAGRPEAPEEGLLARDDFPFVRQILIELHPRNLEVTRRFFALMRKQGYVITHKEPNTCTLPGLKRGASISAERRYF